MKGLLKTCAAVSLFCLTGVSQAGVIFEDDFNSENGGVGALNYTGFDNWSVASGTVDLIGNGFFDFLPGNGLYVDLDGSTNNAGMMFHLETLTAGDYTLSFDLAGNHRNTAPEYTTANVGIVLGTGTSASTTVSLSRYQGFETYSLDFTVSDLLATSIIAISFAGAGGDNIGMLLDNIKLEDKIIEVSEPGSLGMMGIGLLGLGMVRRRLKQNA